MSYARVLSLFAGTAAASIAGAAQPWFQVSAEDACDRSCAVDRLEEALFGALPADQRMAIAGGLIREGNEARARVLLGDVISPEVFEAMRPEWKTAMETLARGGGNGIAACFAPGTPIEVVEAFDQLMFSGDNRFIEGTRWSTTALSGGGLGQGDPTIITYGFVPDGTFIEDAGFGGNNSNLFAWMNGIYGNTATWQALYADVFDRWDELGGTTYVFEPNDDGVNHSNGGNVGIAGVRADIRIGAMNIDGNSGVLAYNFFPNNGDMVLDSADSFYNNTGGGSIRLRNVVSHEAGHGMGMAHVCPTSQTKLMEPFVSTAYDGPQLDDRLHTQRLHGDINEPNNNAAAATDLGTPAFLSLNQLSIDDNSDSDWYSVDFSDPAELTVVVTPTGLTYLSGPQNGNGSCSAGTPFDSLRIHDLSVQIIDTNGFSVLTTVDDGGLGVAETVNFVIDTPGTYFIRVSGDNTNNIQAYNMFTTVDDLPFIPATIQFSGSVPTELDPGVTTPVLVSIDPNDEVVSSQTLFFRADGGAYQSIALTPAGGMLFTADLPAVLCADSPEFYFEIESDMSGTTSLPSAGAASPFSAIVGQLATVFDDNFESNTGWSVSGSIGAASAGRWERGDPVGAGDSRIADPDDDADGSGQCYLTGNVVDNSDVDGGNTILTSPNFDVAGQPEATISYSRWYDNNEDGNAANPFQETFVIEISNNGGASWTNLETVGPNGAENSGGWFAKTFRIADFVAPTANVRIRFIASDDVGTVVEAGVDAVSVSGLTCEDPMGGPCNAADLSELFGVLDLADINTFVAGFTSQSAVADLAAPFGVFDLADINAFVTAFSGGCP